MQHVPIPIEYLRQAVVPAPHSFKGGKHARKKGGGGGSGGGGRNNAVGSRDADPFATGSVTFAEYAERAGAAMGASATGHALHLSGCQDTQTSADISDTSSFKGLPGGAGGAMTSALLSALRASNDRVTWLKLLQDMRADLKQRRYTQVPELSSSVQMDLGREPFALDNPKVAGGGPKRALIIGTNYEGQQGQLSGCVNDAKNFHAYLRSRGWPVDDVNCCHVLSDSRDGWQTHGLPTTENILRQLQWLSENSNKPGTSSVWFYAGHGGTAPTQDPDEPSGLDSTLIPVDYDEPQGGQIRDNQLFQILIARLQGRLVFVSDCCHSGTCLDLPFSSGDLASAPIPSQGAALAPSPFGAPASPSGSAAAPAQPPILMQANPDFKMPFIAKIVKEVLSGAFNAASSIWRPPGHGRGRGGGRSADGGRGGGASAAASREQGNGQGNNGNGRGGGGGGGQGNRGGGRGGGVDNRSKARKAFDLFDNDGSGSISKDELLAAAMLLMPQASPSQITDKVTSMMRRGDRNRDGMLSFEEFETVCSELELQGDGY